MKRELLLKWIDTANLIFNKNDKIVVCPNDPTHSLSIKLVPYTEFGKIELTLECEKCGLQRVFTKEIENENV